MSLFTASKNRLRCEKWVHLSVPCHKLLTVLPSLCGRMSACECVCMEMNNGSDYWGSEISESIWLSWDDRKPLPQPVSHQGDTNTQKCMCKAMICAHTDSHSVCEGQTGAADSLPEGVTGWSTQDGWIEEKDNEHVGWRMTKVSYPNF